MSKKFNLELLQLKYDIGLCEEIPCSDAETQKYMEMQKNGEDLPFDITLSNDYNPDYIKIIPQSITHEDLLDYCALRQAQDIRTIKKCVIFFVVLAVIGIIGAIIGASIIGGYFNSLLKALK